MTSIFSSGSDTSTLMTKQELYNQITAIENIRAHYLSYLEEQEKNTLESIYQKLNTNLALDEESWREIDKIFNRAIKRVMEESL